MFIHLFVFDDDLRGAVEIAQHKNAKLLPTSRMFSIQPTSVTVSPAFARRSSPQVWVLDCVMIDFLFR